MNKITIEQHSEKHYTVKGESVFGSEVIECVCDGYLDIDKLYDRVERGEATEVIALCNIGESQEEMYGRLREEVCRRVLSLMTYIRPSQMLVVEGKEPRKQLECRI